LLQFLIANGRYAVVLKITEKHQLEQISSFMWTAKRYPQKGFHQEDGDEQERALESFPVAICVLDVLFPFRNRFARAGNLESLTY
jgi:hypothetical protein